jgi:hypothetical protein
MFNAVSHRMMGYEMVGLTPAGEWTLRTFAPGYRSHLNTSLRAIVVYSTGKIIEPANTPLIAKDRIL